MIEPFQRGRVKTRLGASRGRRPRLILALLLGPVLVMGCGSGSDSGPADQAESPTGPIRVWGNNYNMDLAEPLLKAYTAEHPKIKFKITRQDDINTAAKVGLQSGSLDLLIHDPGVVTTDLWAEGKLIRPIDNYWKKYHWDDTITEYGKAGATYKGKVYGITNEVSFVAQIYRTSIFKKYGLEKPTTYDEWVKVMDTLKENGETPLVAGVRDGIAAGHVFGPFLAASLGADGVHNLLFGDGKWTDPGVVEAAQRMADASRAGYMDKDILALDYNEGQSRWLSGKGAVDMVGVWAFASAEEAFGPDGYDFMTIPPSDSSITTNYGGGLGSQWSIPTSTDRADDIAELFDWLYSDEGLKMWVEDRDTFPPVKADLSKFDLTPQQLEMSKVIAEADSGTISEWIAPYLSSTLSEAFNQGVSGVISEKVSPEDWLSDMQEAKERGA